MLFNSFQYMLFLPLVVWLYYAIPARQRWILLLAASWYFYACWRVDYLGLLILTTTVDYAAGRLIAGASTRFRKKVLLGVSLGLNVGVLFLFKYFHFANEVVGSVLASFNVFYHAPELHVLLPVGISFYTFQSLSYTVDVYRGVSPAERHFGVFAAYVAFFPQLVAGPIERSTNLLPQLQPSRSARFDRRRAAEGLRLILWGLVKKIVVADRLAYYVEMVYGDVAGHTGAQLLLATYFFAFQIYCDFSGYSDIAIGSARIMNVDLMTNFNQPYLATSIREFWQRWHISLSTWFRDYVYLPLGGNRCSRATWYRNLFLTFVLSGIWHGANWTFVIWGALHGSYLIVAVATSACRERLTRALHLDAVPGLLRVWKTVVTFNLVAIGWVFFRAANVTDATTALRKIGALVWQEAWSPTARVFAAGPWRPADLLLIALILAWVGAYEARRSSRTWPGMASVMSVSVQFWVLVVFGMFNNQAFIYFQF